MFYDNDIFTKPNLFNIRTFLTLASHHTFHVFTHIQYYFKSSECKRDSISVRKLHLAIIQMSSRMLGGNLY